MRRGARGAEAERLVERWLAWRGWRVHRAAAAGLVRLANGRTLCRGHDLFGALDLLAIRHGPAGGTACSWCGKATAVVDGDIRRCTECDWVGILPIHETWALQVTTQAGRCARRRRLEAVDWPSSWRVSLASHEAVPDPANRGRRLHYLRVDDLQDGEWSPVVAIQLDLAAVDAWWRARRRRGDARR